MGRPLKADTVMKNISLRFTESQLEQLEQIAKAQKKSRAELIRESALKLINQ